MEQIRINVAWRKNHEKAAKEWIKKKLDSSDDKDLFTWKRPEASQRG
jgi:hypothetical protein